MVEIKGKPFPAWTVGVKVQNGSGERRDELDLEIEGGGSSWWYVCPECHGAVDRGDRWCRHCGQKFRKERKYEE
jgi:DnaJ-class molecular chaperone